MANKSKAIIVVLSIHYLSFVFINLYRGNILKYSPIVDKLSRLISVCLLLLPYPLFPGLSCKYMHFGKILSL